MKIKVAGLDPSMSNLGVALAEFDVITNEITPTSIHLIETERRSGKGIRQTSDDLRRCREISLGLEPLIKSATMVMSETTFFSKDANSAKSAGISIMLLGSLRLPIIEVSAQQSKRVATGYSTASKQEMIDWATELHPSLPWAQHKRAGELIYTGKNEHMADALAAIYAGVETQQFKEAVAIYRSMFSSV